MAATKAGGVDEGAGVNAKDGSAGRWLSITGGQCVLLLIWAGGVAAIAASGALGALIAPRFHWLSLGAVALMLVMALCLGVQMLRGAATAPCGEASGAAGRRELDLAGAASPASTEGPHVAAPDELHAACAQDGLHGHVHVTGGWRVWVGAFVLLVPTALGAWPGTYEQGDRVVYLARAKGLHWGQVNESALVEQFPAPEGVSLPPPPMSVLEPNVVVSTTVAELVLSAARDPLGAGLVGRRVEVGGRPAPRPEGSEFAGFTLMQIRMICCMADAQVYAVLVRWPDADAALVMPFCKIEGVARPQRVGEETLVVIEAASVVEDNPSGFWSGQM